MVKLELDNQKGWETLIQVIVIYDALKTN
jgi:hypothetical protein